LNDEYKRTKTDARITVGNRWLVWDESALTWKVYERKVYAKKTLELAQK
jgi:hypothetical protein